MAKAFHHHILTLESDERVFLLTASSESPSTDPNPKIPSAHPILVVSWAVLLCEKKTFVCCMFLRLESVEVGPANIGVNMGYGISKGIWQGNPLIHYFLLSLSTVFFNPSHLGWKEKDAFKVTRWIFLLDWWTSSLCPFNNQTEDFGNVCDSPTTGPGTVAHMFWRAAANAILKNERRMSRQCHIGTLSPRSFSNESLLKEGLTQIAETCVWNKRSCNKHFRL